MITGAFWSDKSNDFQIETDDLTQKSDDEGLRFVW